MRKIIFSSIVVSALFAVSCQKINSVSHCLFGTVCDESGKALSGANVSIEGWSFVTKSDGTYRFDDMLDKAYTIEATKTGFYPFTGTVSLSGADKLFDIVLRQKNASVDIDCDEINFEDGEKLKYVTIYNFTSQTISFTANSENRAIKVSPTSGTLGSQSSNTLAISLDWAFVDNDFSASIELDFSDGSNFLVRVTALSKEKEICKIDVKCEFDNPDYGIISFFPNSKTAFWYYFIGNKVIDNLDKLYEKGVYVEGASNSTIEFNPNGDVQYVSVAAFNSNGQTNGIQNYRFDAPPKYSSAKIHSVQWTSLSTSIAIEPVEYEDMNYFKCFSIKGKCDYSEYEYFQALSKLTLLMEEGEYTYWDKKLDEDTLYTFALLPYDKNMKAGKPYIFTARTKSSVSQPTVRLMKNGYGWQANLSADAIGYFVKCISYEENPENKPEICFAYDLHFRGAKPNWLYASEITGEFANYDKTKYNVVIAMATKYFNPFNEDDRSAYISTLVLP